MTLAEGEATGLDTPPLGAVGSRLLLSDGPPEGPRRDDGTLLLELNEEPQRAYLCDTSSGARVRIHRVPFCLGRAADCDLILEHPTVSRRHAQLELAAGIYCLQDLESSNGVTVNDESVQRTLLVAGDIIQLGRVRLRFELGPEEKEPVNLPCRRRRRKGYLIVAVLSVLTAGLGVVTERFSGRSQAGPEFDAAVGYPGPAGWSMALEATRAPVLGPSLDALITQATGSLANPAASTQRSESDGAVADAAVERRVRAEGGAGADAAASASRSNSSRNTQPVGRDASPAAVPTSRPRPTAAVSSMARGRMLAARDAYLEGQAPTALAMLNANQASGDAKTDREVEALRQRLQTLMRLYGEAQSRFDRGDQDGAFRHWGGFLAAEREWLGARTSVYTKTVRDRVLGAYHRLGEQAVAQRRFKDAYRLWAQAAAIDPDGDSARRLRGIKEKARSLFREGYRLEAANLAQARKHWQEVVEMVPPSNEYHIKARAKLAWYARYGR